MKRKLMLGLTAVLVLATLACGVIDTTIGKLIGGGDNMNVASQLWPDVPKMDGLTQSQMDMPLPVKLVMRAVLGNLGRLNKEGEDKTTGNVDWIVFTTAKTANDVKNFYTNARMTAQGWEASQQSTCVSGSEQGVPQVGLFCVFVKLVGNQEIGLLIIAAPDDQTKQTNLFFLRLEVVGTPVPNKQPTAIANKQPTRGVITMLNGPAPYGIEKRPMPTGVNLDQLLPKQVGPYTRASIEGAPLQVDGNSVYARYRSGATEIFVEFAVNSSAANAQATLETAAGETTGRFPTDPRVGSLGTEPSYLKVNNESGAFFAWTRGGYYFSASAKSGASALDPFMQAFPY